MSIDGSRQAVFFVQSVERSVTEQGSSSAPIHLLPRSVATAVSTEGATLQRLSLQDAGFAIACLLAGLALVPVQLASMIGFDATSLDRVAPDLVLMASEERNEARDPRARGLSSAALPVQKSGAE